MRRETSSSVQGRAVGEPGGGPKCARWRLDALPVVLLLSRWRTWPMRFSRSCAGGRASRSARSGIGHSLGLGSLTQHDDLSWGRIALDVPAGELGRAIRGAGVAAVGGGEGALAGEIEGSAGDDLGQLHQRGPTVSTRAEL